MATITDVMKVYKGECRFMFAGDIQRFDKFLGAQAAYFSSQDFDEMISTAYEIMDILDKKNTVPIGELLSTEEDKVQYYLDTTAELKNEVQGVFLNLWNKLGIDAHIWLYSAYDYAGRAVFVDNTPLFFVPMEEIDEDPSLSISYEGSDLLTATSSDFSTITLNTANTYLTSDIIITVPSDFSINVSYFSYDTIIASASGTTITLQTANKILEDDIVISLV